MSRPHAAAGIVVVVVASLVAEVVVVRLDVAVVEEDNSLEA